MMHSSDCLLQAALPPPLINNDAQLLALLLFDTCTALEEEDTDPLFDLPFLLLDFDFVVDMYVVIIEMSF